MGDSPEALSIGAVVLAAGQSRRMGSPKMVLPWGAKAVINRVVDVLLQCGVEPVVVVTGGAQEAVQKALTEYPIIFAENKAFQTTEMLDSLRIGLTSLSANIAAMLVVLGDNPQIDPTVVQSILERYRSTRSKIIVPSYQFRRGHPWLLDRSLWNEIQDLGPDKSLRDFLDAHAKEIDYLTVDTSSILGDLDTPQDYEKSKP